MLRVTTLREVRSGFFVCLFLVMASAEAGMLPDAMERSFDQSAAETPVNISVCDADQVTCFKNVKSICLSDLKKSCADAVPEMFERCMGTEASFMYDYLDKIIDIKSASSIRSMPFPASEEHNIKYNPRREPIFSCAREALASIREGESRINSAKTKKEDLSVESNIKSAMKCLKVSRDANNIAHYENMCKAPIEVGYCVIGTDEKLYQCKNKKWGVTAQWTSKPGVDYKFEGSKKGKVYFVACDKKDASFDEYEDEDGKIKFRCMK